MTAYYNENNKYAAEWLRNLIDAGCIAPGVVDDRSIEDVLPSDLRGFTQCHFFAGIGVWSHALRSAGWSDERPVWTGSCPCQPFSAAGTGAGFSDERHLWPAFHHLIEQCRPSSVLGEQVASKDANPWIDLVQTDLEALGYGVGAIAFPSAGVGAPHIRDRLYWVANTNHARLEGRRAVRECADQCTAWAGGVAGGMADTSGERRQQDARSTPSDEDAHGVARWQQQQSNSHHKPASNGQVPGAQSTGPTNGYWRDADWLFCRDGKWRPVEPGTFPLAHGAPARVGRLRAYGNAINAKAAQVFIESVMA